MFLPSSSIISQITLIFKLTELKHNRLSVYVNIAQKLNFCSNVGNSSIFTSLKDKKQKKTYHYQNQYIRYPTQNLN